MTSQRQFPCKRKAAPQEQTSPLLLPPWSPPHTHTHAHTFILSHVRLFFTPWTAAHQAPLSMGCSRQEYWSRFLFPPPRDLRNTSLLYLLHWQADSLPLCHLGNPLPPHCLSKVMFCHGAGQIQRWNSTCIQCNCKFLLIHISKKSGYIVGMGFKLAGPRRLEH